MTGSDRQSLGCTELEPGTAHGTGGDEGRLLTVGQVAERLALSSAAVRGLIKKGQLAAYLIGRSYRVAPAAIDSFLEDRAVQTPRRDWSSFNLGRSS